MHLYTIDENTHLLVLTAHYNSEDTKIGQFCKQTRVDVTSYHLL